MYFCIYLHILKTMSSHCYAQFQSGTIEFRPAHPATHRPPPPPLPAWALIPHERPPPFPLSLLSLGRYPPHGSTLPSFPAMYHPPSFPPLQTPTLLGSAYWLLYRIIQGGSQECKHKMRVGMQLRGRQNEAATFLLIYPLIHCL